MRFFKIDLIFSVCLHLAVLFLFVNYSNTAYVSTKVVAKPIPQPIIKATLVDKQQLDKEVQYLLQQEKSKRQKISAQKNKLAKQQNKLQAEQLILKKAKQQLKSEQELVQKIKSQMQQEKQQAIKMAQALKIAQGKARQLELKQQMQQQNLIAQELQRAKQSFKQQVQLHWVRPYGLDQSLQCGFDIHLNKNGEITAVAIFESSGNSAFDALAQKAIHKASPLHSLPTNRQVLEKLKHFRFIFEA